MWVFTWNGKGLVNSSDDIKLEVFSHFHKIFTEPEVCRPRLLAVNFNILSKSDISMLDRPFSMEKVKDVIWNSDSEKSLGPDVFNVGFFKKCWEIVKDDLFGYISEFYLNAILPKVDTIAFSALLPKSSNPQGLTGLMKNVMQLGLFQPFKVSNDIMFNLLQFMDDTIIVREGTWHNLWTIKVELRGFELASGSVCKLQQKQSYWSQSQAGGFRGCLDIFGLWCQYYPFLFLGISVGDNLRRQTTWRPLLDKLKN
ncbi:hypothetical protein KIW84_014700 [Lathyrus oleraceus]|uniref:Uncharacterized protein n=1 Tax=Pisum sativum TaxID=3888 RepID=A0A9D5BNS2_PEA|nr:hypothetical protein KIW84_014700 [Pisum sativum]